MHYCYILNRSWISQNPWQAANVKIRGRGCLPMKAWNDVICIL